MATNTNPTKNNRSPQLRCVWCGAPLAEDGTCVECGRKQSRICECGYELAPADDVCPNCGAQWQGLVKVKRRKRSHRKSLVGFIRYGLAGMIIAVVTGILANGIVTSLALKGTDETQLPDSIYLRLQLAMQTVAGAVAEGYQVMTQRLSASAGLIALAAAGVIAGIIYYMYTHQTGIFDRRSGQNPGNASRHRRT